MNRNRVIIIQYKKIHLKQDLNDAAKLILSDRKHLDNNPKKVNKSDIIFLLRHINDEKSLDKF